MASSSLYSPTITDKNQQLLSLTNAAELLNNTLNLFADQSLLTTGVNYSSASVLSASTSTTATTDTTASTQVNPDGTYTVAGWTWNPNNAVTSGSVIFGQANISTFASGFLDNEGRPLATQTVGSILSGQSNGSTTLGNSRNRSELELDWGGQGLPNGLGNDFVIYENGNLNAPEGYAVAVRLAGSDTFSAFRYEFYDTYDGVNGLVLATAFDLSDFGIADGQSIDAIQIINLQPDDLVDGNGQGFLSTSGTTPLDPSTGKPFANNRLDPDITFVAGLHNVQPVQISNFQIVGTGDFNGDRQTDILRRDPTTGENVVWLMNGTHVVSTVELPVVNDPNWNIVGTGDFNGDAQTDILWRNQATGEDTIWLMNGTDFVQGVGLPPVGDSNWEIKGTGDFNSDGKTDILWRNEATGEDTVWLMNGIYFAAGAYLNPNPLTTPGFDIVGTGDFNGDGQSDILWRSETTGENVIWEMNGINFVAGIDLPFVRDPNWNIVGTGDFNSDGKTDILWSNQSTKQNVAWVMNDTEFAYGVVLT